LIPEKWLYRQPLHLACLVVLGLFVGGACTKAPPSEAPEFLSPDLVKLLTETNQIKVLTLPPETQDVEWLSSSSVEFLSVRNCQIRAIKSLPTKLRALDVSGCPDLAAVPGRPKLESLNVAGTKVSAYPVGDLKNLGMSLGQASLLPGEDAALSGLALESEGETPAWEGLRGLPGSLRSLVLNGNGFRSLEGLPPLVTRLWLSDTSIRDLDAVTVSAIGSLSILDNQLLEYSYWPENLYSLRYDGVQATDVDAGTLPRSITELIWEQGEINNLDQLPGLITRLHLPGCRQYGFKDFPFVGPECPEVAASGGGLKRDLPGALTHLAVVGPVEALCAAAIAHFTLSRFEGTEFDLASIQCQDGAVADTDSLLTLDLSHHGGITKISSLKDAAPNLRNLILADTPALSELGDLPGGLKTLDLRNSGITGAISGIPDTVDTLLLDPSANFSWTKIPESLRAIHLIEKDSRLETPFFTLVMDGLGNGRHP
jgi:Leucine-rich repeat (LRR) protein